MTNNPLLPIIDQLARADDAASRARWLPECPLSILMSYEFTIRARLRNAHFLAGVDYLDAEIAVMRSVRRAGLIVTDNPHRLALMEVAGYRAIRASDI